MNRIASAARTTWGQTPSSAQRGEAPHPSPSSGKTYSGTNVVGATGVSAVDTQNFFARGSTFSPRPTTQRVSRKDL